MIDQKVVKRAADGEPVFVIRAGDICAPHAIKAWIEAAIAAGAHALKISDAITLRDRVIDWQRHNGAKIPD